MSVTVKITSSFRQYSHLHLCLERLSVCQSLIYCWAFVFVFFSSFFIVCLCPSLSPSLLCPLKYHFFFSICSFCFIFMYICCCDWLIYWFSYLFNLKWWLDFLLILLTLDQLNESRWRVLVLLHLSYIYINITDFDFWDDREFI